MTAWIALGGGCDGGAAGQSERRSRRGTRDRRAGRHDAAFERLRVRADDGSDDGDAVAGARHSATAGLVGIHWDAPLSGRGGWVSGHFLGKPQSIGGSLSTALATGVVRDNAAFTKEVLSDIAVIR